ncbi:hypothetical protein CGRA01v4_11808 [Colletotrichum graminicola]|nr:hypothetical protein CGRA01v4_11808 [Colletotrichum graminicola]
MQLPEVRWVGQASLGPLPLHPSTAKPKTHTFLTSFAFTRQVRPPSTVHLRPSLRWR